MEHYSGRGTARAVGIGVVAALVVALFVLAFAWPGITSEPKDIPLAVVGPDAVVGQVEGALDEAAPGVFEFEAVADRDEAVRAIEERTALGGLVVGQAPEVLTASAASPAVAQQLTALASRLQEQVNAAAAAQAPEGVTPPAITVDVTDVVPLVDGDPRGTGLVSAMFPLVLGGMLGGIAVSLAVSGRARRLLALAVYAGVAAPTLTGILHSWFAVVPGDFWTITGVFALALIAVAAPIVGLAALLGRPGIPLGAATFVLFANPISSAAQPVQFLPEPWGAIGQWFPPGASATLLRDVAYFPDADAAFPWLVLTGWALAGVLLTLVSARRGAVLEARRDDVDPVREPAFA